MTDFEISIENSLKPELYTKEYLGNIASEINQTADQIKHYCFNLTEIAHKSEVEKDWRGNEIEPTNSLEYSIIRLE